MISWLMNGVYLLLGGLLLPWLIWRSILTGRYRRDLLGKLFGTRLVLPSDLPVAWFHGVSVGEIHLLTTVIAAFRQRFPNFQVVVSSTTDTGLSEARLKFPDCSVIPFPFDFSWSISRTLKALQPRLIVLAESEVWPNFLRLASRLAIPVSIINGRLSPRSFRRWSRVPVWLRSGILHHVSLWVMQSEEYAERLKQLGVKANTVVVSGSVKYDGATGDQHTPKARELRTLLGLTGEDKPLIWVAGSTHAPEEQLCLKAYARLRAKYPQLKLILVPRHPDRFAEVAKILESTGFDWLRRSTVTKPLAELPSVLLLDTVGELGAVWALADVGYVGGTFDGFRGGQSMIEPAGYGVPTVFGPFAWNFRDAAQRLVEAQGAFQVRTAEELLNRLDELCSNSELRITMGQAAQALVQAQQGATRRTLDALASLIPTSPPPG